MSVGKNLDFHVVRPVEILFEVQAVVAESIHGFGRSVAKRRFEFGVAGYEAHTFAAAAGDGFQKDGVAHALRQGLCFGGIFDGVVRPGNRGNIDATGQPTAGRFGAERLHGVGWRTDKRETRNRASARQSGVFREKPIARMYRIATGAARYIHELINAKIAFARGRGADGIGFIGEAHVKRLAIGITEDGDGADAQLAAGAQDAHGNLTAIGDQDFFEHT